MKKIEAIVKPFKLDDIKDRLDEIAAGLFARERCEGRVVNGALSHDAGDRKGELLGDLLQRQLGNVDVAAALLSEPLVIGVASILDAFCRDVNSGDPCGAGQAGDAVAGA